MMQQIDTFLSKKPDRRTLVIVMVLLAMLCLCCLCLMLFLWRGTPQQATPTDTPTATETPTLTPTFTPSVTGSLTPTLTPTASVTPSPSASTTTTLTPTATYTPTITPTPNPFSGAEHLAVFLRTGSVWVTSRNNNKLVELDGTDLHVLSSLDLDSPNGIAIYQETGLAYVTNRKTGTVTEIDLVAKKITRVIVVGKEPFGVSVVQNTGVVFVANRGSNSISCIAPGGDQALTATPLRIELNEPFSIFGFSLNTDIPNAAIAVDRHGQVGAVRLDTGTQFKTLSTPPCSVYLLTTIEKDVLVDITQASEIATNFYVSDSSGKKIVMLQNVQDLSSTVELAMPDQPGAVADLGKCVAVVVPNQNRLYFIDTALTKAYKRVNLGKQGKDGGLGLAYNPQTDTVYVANAGDNTVTRVSNPCQ